MFEGDDLSEVVPYIGVLVKPNGGGWHPAVTERNVADRRVTVKRSPRLLPTKSP